MTETLCPFEKVKEWKTGVSIKCPKTTTVIWTKDKEDALQRHQVIKRKITCRPCISSFEPFIDSLGDPEIE